MGFHEKPSDEGDAELPAEGERQEEFVALSK
jgi:hypothetical protein